MMTFAWGGAWAQNEFRGREMPFGYAFLIWQGLLGVNIRAIFLWIGLRGC